MRVTAVETEIVQESSGCLDVPCFCRAEEETVLRLCVEPDMRELVLCTETAEDRKEWVRWIQEAMECKVETETVLETNQQADGKSRKDKCQ